MASLIDNFSTITDEEREYKAHYIRNSNSKDILHLPSLIEEDARKKDRITLPRLAYLENKHIAIQKHPCYMPIFLHSHDFVEMTYIVKGDNAVENIEGDKLILKEKDLLILFPGYYHTIEVFDDKTIALNILVDTAWLYNNEYINIDRNSIYSVFSNIDMEYLEKAFAEDNQDIKELLFSIFLVQAFSNGILTNNATDESNRKEIYKILSYIDENILTISLSSLADHFSITEQYASKQIKTLFGRNYTQIVLEKKMNTAISLLRNGLSGKETAYTLGYTQEHFSRLFKKHFGKTPDTMRAMLLN